VPVVKIDMKQFVEQTKRMAEELIPTAVEGAYLAALRGVGIMQRRTREAPPANPAGKGSGGAVNLGDLLRGWKAEQLSDGARVYNIMGHAPVVEHGRRANKKPPPSDVIARWLQRRLGMSEDEARSIAFPVARAIGKRGLKGRKIAEGGQEEIAEIALEEIERTIRDKFGGEAR
jgi:hypothetical protein